jgi:hypothetical protein
MSGMPRTKGSALLRLLIIGGKTIGTKSTTKKIKNPNLLFSFFERCLSIVTLLLSRCSKIPAYPLEMSDFLLSLSICHKAFSDLSKNQADPPHHTTYFLLRCIKSDLRGIPLLLLFLYNKKTRSPYFW